MLRTLVAASLICLGVAEPSAAQESLNQSMPGSVFVAPLPGPPELDTEEPNEVATDMPLFLSHGFAEPDWDAHSSRVGEVARDLVIPDYVKRTGNAVPESQSIEIASAQITKKGFNDLVVISRLPGDCGEDGCLVMVFSMEGRQWVKVTEFKATGGIAIKDDKEPGSTIIAAVGDSVAPSRLIYWDGTKFGDGK